MPAWIGDGYGGAGTKSFKWREDFRVKIGIWSFVWSLVGSEDLEMIRVPGDEVDSSALYMR